MLDYNEPTTVSEGVLRTASGIFWMLTALAGGSAAAGGSWAFFGHVLIVSLILHYADAKYGA